MRHIQRNQADWDIIGNIASITDKPSVLILRIASNLKTYRQGKMLEDPHFNTIYIYKEDIRGHILSGWEVGDLIHAVGTFKEQHTRDENGKVQRQIQLRTSSIARLAKKNLLA